MSLAPSSPRLPSPPPPAENQIGPNSPSGGPAATLESAAMEQSLLDANSKRRVHVGTKAADMAAGPPLVPLNELESAFQLQEHLAALHFYHTSFGTHALTRAAALQLAQPPPGVDRTIWLYELCRFLIAQCNSLIVGFLFDAPPCSASTCPEMRASEWQFLCAVHEQPKSCCAIDYCCHTLDWAANVVTDQKLFPSRFAAAAFGAADAHGGSGGGSKNAGLKSLVNVFRRLHRIFAHAWFQHRAVFWSVEGQTGLYVFFKSVCDLYDLLPAENYKLPPEAEGLEAPSADPEPEKPAPQILKPPSQHQQQQSQQRGSGGTGDDENLHSVGRTNTRRHIRSSPSTGSAVTTVMEADEDEGDGVARKLKEMHLSPPETVAEESEVADVPVIVEQSMMAGAPSQDRAPTEPLKDDAKDDADAGEISDADQTVVEVEPEEDSSEEEDEAAPIAEDAAAPVASQQLASEPTAPTEPEDSDQPEEEEQSEPGAAAGTSEAPASTTEPDSSATESPAPDAAESTPDADSAEGPPAATAAEEEK